MKSELEATSFEAAASLAGATSEADGCETVLTRLQASS